MYNNKIGSNNSSRTRSIISTNVIKKYPTIPVNDVVVKPLPRNKDKDILRSSIFKKPHNVTYFASTMGSGKTTALYTTIKNHIMHYPLQKVATIKKPKLKITIDGYGDGPEEDRYERKLTVMIFSGTVYNDDVYESIINLLKNTGVEYGIETSTYDADGVNILARIMNKLIEATSEPMKRNAMIGNIQNTSNNYEQLNNNKSLIEKYINDLTKPLTGQEYLFVFDDLSSELRKNSAIIEMIKLIRHLKIINIIICSQSPLDFSPDMLNQCCNMVIFKDLPEDRLKHLHKWLTLKNNFEEFQNIYKEATKEKHNFLMIDKPNQTYYKNFNEMFYI